jgi:hypothetical protein
MKLVELLEAVYEKDYPDGMPRKGINDTCDHIAKQLGTHPNNVNFLGPGQGSKLPGWIELAKADGDAHEVWDLTLRVAPGAIKKAFKAHLGLDVAVTAQKRVDPKHTIVSFDVEPLPGK